MEITRGKIAGAKKVVVYGPEGIGKSTFAGAFPDPVFIDTEGSTKEMDVARLPRPSSWSMLLEEIDYVKYSNPAVCKTLVVDTIDWAEQMCVEHVCSKHHKSGIEEFGYGNGYVYVKEEFGRFLNKLEDIVEKGVNVVLTAHSQMRKFEQPDEMGAYDRYELKLGKKTSSQTSPLVKEWADMLLFANYKTYSVATDSQGKKYKAQGGKRVMYTQHHPCWDAKNRYGLADELPFDYKEIAHVLKSGTGSASSSSKVPASQSDTVHMEENTAFASTETRPMGKAGKDKGRARDVAPSFTNPSPPMEKFMEVPDGVPEQMEFTADGNIVPPTKNVQETRAKPVPEVRPPRNVPELFKVSDKIPKALRDLMEVNLVSEEELMEAIYSRGFFPRGTPFENMPQDYVNDVLIAAWSQVMSVITDMRKNYKVPFD